VTDSTTRPLVSILVPCHNAASFLAETLRSAVAQAVPGGIETIVLDDGSTDDSVSVALSFGSALRVESQPNAGASVTRTRLTTMATGEFIQYLDADDVLPDGAIAARVESLRRTGADAAYSDWQKLVPDGSGAYVRGSIEHREYGPTSGEAALAMFRGAWSPPAAWTFRRSLVERLPGWRVDLPVIQDARFTLDAALAGARFVHVPGVGALYRTGRSDSLSWRDFPAFLADCLRNAEGIRETLAARGAFDAEWRDAVADAYNYVARSAFAIAPETSRRAWTELLRLEPRRVPLWPRVAFGLAGVIGHERAGRVMGVVDRLRRA
jgi:hypothetical protein